MQYTPYDQRKNQTSYDAYTYNPEFYSKVTSKGIVSGLAIPDYYGSLRMCRTRYLRYDAALEAGLRMGLPVLLEFRLESSRRPRVTAWGVALKTQRETQGKGGILTVALPRLGGFSDLMVLVRLS